MGVVLGTQGIGPHHDHAKEESNRLMHGSGEDNLYSYSFLHRTDKHKVFPVDGASSFGGMSNYSPVNMTIIPIFQPVLLAPPVRSGLVNLANSSGLTFLCRYQINGSSAARSGIQILPFMLALVIGNSPYDITLI